MKNPKKMSCGELRDLLTRDAGAGLQEGPEQHLEGCDGCRAYAARLSNARQLLRDHHGNVEPDAGFTGRVMARLPQGPTEVLGWAAVRLLPATVALALVLAWFVFQTPAPDTATTAEMAAPTDDLLSWVLDPTGSEQ